MIFFISRKIKTLLFKDNVYIKTINNIEMIDNLLAVSNDYSHRKFASANIQFVPADDEILQNHKLAYPSCSEFRLKIF